MKLLSVVAIAIASAIALASTGANAVGEGELYIDPQSSYVGPGQAFEVDVVAVPPDSTLAAWVIEVHFDPDVIAYIDCEPLQLPPGFIWVTDCGAKDTGGSPDDDAFVSLGAALDPQTMTGISSTVVLATITFQAVGPLGSSSSLDFQIIDYLGPDPNTPSFHPAITNGYVEITNDPPPPPTPSPTPPLPATATPSPTPIPVGGSVTLTTTPPASSSLSPAIALAALALIASALAALRLTPHPRS